MKITWTREAIEGLGIKTDVPTAGSILGDLCKDEAYRMVKRGEFPVPVLKVGRKIWVPTAGILAALGLDTDAAGPPAPAAADHAQTARANERSDDAKPTRRQLRALG